MKDAAIMNTLLFDLSITALRSRNDFPSYTVEYIDDNCRELLGVSSQDLTHNKRLGLFDLVHPDDLSALCEKLRSTIMRPPPDTKALDTVYRIIRENGEIRWIWHKGHVTEFSDDHRNSIVEGVLIDVSGKMEDTTTELLSQARAEFLSRTSYRIRTPISSISGIASLLLETPLDSRQNKYATSLKESADELLDIVNELLDISVIDTSGIRLHKHNFSPREVLLELQEFFLHRARRKGVVIDFCVDDDVPEVVCGDAFCLKQILMNLLTSVIKYIENDTITLSCQLDRRAPAEENAVRLQFKLKAPCAQTREPLGLPDDAEDNPFEKRGVALSASKKLVELMRGEISIDATEQGFTKFYLTAPFGCVECATPDARMSEARLQPLTILLVEDVPVNQLVARTILEKFGHRVLFCGNGVEALEMLKNRKFDLILMDCQMPVMDGYETTKRLREGTSGEMNANAPIVAMTANAMLGDRQKCIDAGMNDYITKPFAVEQMKNVIEKWRDK